MEDLNNMVEIKYYPETFKGFAWKEYAKSLKPGLRKSHYIILLKDKFYTTAILYAFLNRKLRKFGLSERDLHIVTFLTDIIASYYASTKLFNSYKDDLARLTQDYQNAQRLLDLLEQEKQIFSSLRAGITKIDPDNKANEILYLDFKSNIFLNPIKEVIIENNDQYKKKLREDIKKHQSELEAGNKSIKSFKRKFSQILYDNIENSLSVTIKSHRCIIIGYIFHINQIGQFYSINGDDDEKSYFSEFLEFDEQIDQQTPSKKPNIYDYERKWRDKIKFYLR